MARVVERLKGHASRDRPITNDRHGVAQTFGGDAAQITRHGKSQGGGDGGGAMRRAKGVIGAFGAFGETR